MIWHHLCTFVLPFVCAEGLIRSFLYTLLVAWTWSLYALVVVLVLEILNIGAWHNHSVGRRCLMENQIKSNQIKSNQIKSNHIISYHIISYHIISYHIISYHIISYHIISYHIISYHIISYHIISYHIISYHIICIWCEASTPQGLPRNVLETGPNGTTQTVLEWKIHTPNYRPILGSGNEKEIWKKSPHVQGETRKGTYTTTQHDTGVYPSVQ